MDSMINILKSEHGYELITDGRSYAVLQKRVFPDSGVVCWQSAAKHANGGRNYGSRMYAAIWQHRRQAEVLYAASVKMAEFIESFRPKEKKASAN